MQKNGVNGGHRHETSEKRVNRSTFPCRLDMELCACGEKRWMNQDGNVATPWQFINEIQVNAGKAVVHYSIPLPEDSPLACMRRQEIDLPEEILA